MINFRYHIVSLTAVFLALVIGILMGTTVVSKATVDGLKANLQRAEARSASVHRTNDRLSSELSARTKTGQALDDSLTDSALVHAVDGALEGVPVLIVATEKTDKNLLERTTTALRDSGAALDGTLVIDDRMVLNAADATKVADLVDLPSERDVQGAVIHELAVALATAALPGTALKGVPTTTTTTSTTVAPAGEQDPQSPGSVPAENPAGNPVGDEPVAPTTTVPVAVEPDVVAALRGAGFLTFKPLDGSSGPAAPLTAPELASGTGYRYVLLPGDGPDPLSSDVLAPLISELASLGPVAQVAANGPRTPVDPGEDIFLTPLLARTGVKGQISTVDNAGSFAGDVAVVYALAEAGAGRFGSYGIGDTASTPMPTWTG